MSGIVRVNAPDTSLSGFLDSPDPIYGTGMDGDRVLDGTSTVLGMEPSSSVYSMTRDMYFNNLIINAGVRLAPNGYRIFVKNILTLNNNSIIGFLSGYATAGSISQGGSLLSSVTNSLGGSALATYTAIAPLASVGGVDYYKIPHQAIRGYSITAASGSVNFLRGGAGALGELGGGIVILSARYINCNATSQNAVISAKAISPAGGGVVLIVSSAASLPANVSTDVTGANPGTVNYMQLV
jgi:hypothetical protein